MSWLAWTGLGLGGLIALLAVDRLLLWAESRGWINYRRNKLSRGGALYHTKELHSIFDPGMKSTVEVEYAEEREEDEWGAPPGSGPRAAGRQSAEESRSRGETTRDGG